MPHPERSRLPLLVAALALAGLAFMAPPANPQSTTTSLTVAVVGDLGISATTEKNIDLAAARGAQGLIGLGDYNYDGSIRGWNAVVEPLTSRGAWFALGNHDRLQDFQARMPGGQAQWSILLSGVRVVAINTQASVSPGTSQYTWLAAELSREPASGAKIMVMHKPWWLGAGAEHPASQFPGDPAAMDALVTSKGVDMVLTGHEHNYQRTQRNSVPYLIVGTGGVSIYPVAGSASGTVATCACYGHVELTLSSGGLTARFIDIDGVQRDAVTVGTASGFTAAFTKVRGTASWVETNVDANLPLAGIDARVNAGAWIALTKQSWGSWAKSIPVPSGANVEFRARAATGETSQSAVYAWPPGSGLTAAFSDVRGHEWWVETKVTANQAVTGLDARKNGGSWIPLSQRSWGAWAGSFNVQAGSFIEFRATNANGESVVSSRYAWPPA